MRTNQKDKLPKPSIKDSRVLMYLGVIDEQAIYQNTESESELAQLWNAVYKAAVAEYESTRVNSKNVAKWRRAYMGDFNKLDEHGEETDEKLKALRKMAYELVEQKVNARIPAPKMSPRYHSDLIPVEATETLIKHEMNRMLSEEVQDESEHSTLIDSTSWFKVSWNPFDNTHERSGMPLVEVCAIDTVFPQPGISDYKKLEYIFHKRQMTLTQVNDLFGRIVKPLKGDLINVVECYYLNEDRHVGRFVWVPDDLTVLANDLEWGMRRRRECSACNTIVNTESECPTCGGSSFHYVGVKEHTLKEDLVYIENPYRSGDEQDKSKDEMSANPTKTIPKGTTIPYYLIRQLPFIPKRTIKLTDDIYGISEVQLQLEPQDLVNKFYNKAERKSSMSKAYVTKLKDTRINDEDSEIAYIEVESAQEGQAIQVKQVAADITEELTMAQTLYEVTKSTAGVTDTDQGKYDPTARSGKAKEIQLMASEQRQAAPTTQRNIAYAGVYELIFKYMLAYSNEERSFIRLLPDGTKRQEVWSRYMFLDKDENGKLYYRDDFAWSVDEASAITEDRASMWQIIDQDFINGTLGSEIDPIRALRMYWHMKDQYGYPTAKFALAFLEEAVEHLPAQIEQALVNNPEAVELALSYIADMQSGKGVLPQNTNNSSEPSNNSHGGARDNAGKPSNQQTHDQQQQRTNEKNKVKQEVMDDDKAR